MSGTDCVTGGLYSSLYRPSHSFLVALQQAGWGSEEVGGEEEVRRCGCSTCIIGRSDRMTNEHGWWKMTNEHGWWRMVNEHGW